MKDTSKKVNKLYRRMLSEISGEKRIKMGFSMFGFAKRVSLASLKEEELSEKDIQKRIFKRIYGSDFGKRKLEQILAAF